MLRLREDIYQECLNPHICTFADGQAANNKIDAELLQANPELRTRVSDAIANLVVGHRPDMLIAVPNGANWLALDVAGRLGIAVTLLAKDEITKEVSFYDDDQARFATAERVVVVEDIVNRRTSSARVLDLPGVAERALAVAAIIDRSLSEERVALLVPVECLIYEPIPPMMPPDSPLRMFMA